MGLFWVVIRKVILNPILSSNLPIFLPLNGNISHAIPILGALGIYLFIYFILLIFFFFFFFFFFFLR